MQNETYIKQIDEAAAFIREYVATSTYAVQGFPTTAIILGSGLGKLVDFIDNQIVITPNFHQKARKTTSETPFYMAFPMS